MAKVRFIPNPRFEQEIAREVEYVAGLTARAEVIKDRAQQIAPVRKTDLERKPPPGSYKRGLKVKVIGPHVYLAGTDFKSHWIEWGSVNNREFAVIRRACLESGLRILELPKRNTRADRRGVIEHPFSQVVRGVG